MTIAEFFQTHEWTQYRYARNINKVGCWPTEEAACSFCLIGASIVVYTDPEVRAAVTVKLLEAVVPKGYLGPAAWNDAKGRTKDEVIQLCQELGV